MAKSNRGRAPRDRKRPVHFPKPPCSPEPPRDPEPVRPPIPDCVTGPDPRDLLKRLKKKR